MLNNQLAARWRLFLGVAGMLATILACTATGMGIPTPGGGTANPGVGKNAVQVPIRLDNGTVEVQDQNGNWNSVSENAPLDVTAPLENTDPWTVSGTRLQTDESTRIEEGLQTGDLVRVQGLILDNGNWLANSIERAPQQVDPIVVVVGKVDSVDPWSVNGIPLKVTADTDIQGTITPGQFARVEVLLSPDGTWEVLSIAPLGNTEGNVDCETVAARVTSVNGNEVQLSGWPAITLSDTVQVVDESGAAATLTPGQTVLITVCPSGESQVEITKVTVLNNAEDGDNGENGDTGENGGKVLICHKPDKKGGHTISVAPPAVPAHLAHGDTKGPCTH